MRIWEILLEYREAIDTNDYGAWITNDGNVLRVKNDCEHASVAAEYLNEPCYFKKTYKDVYRMGWIRICNEWNALVIEGKKDAIIKRWRIIAPTAMRMDTIRIGIIVPEKDSFHPERVYTIHLPQEKEKLFKFINGKQIEADDDNF